MNQRPYLWRILFSLLVAFLSPSVFAQWRAPAVGTIVTQSLSIESERDLIQVPLPAGEWTVVYGGQEQGPRRTNMSAGNDYGVVVMIQTEGDSVRHVLWVHSNINNRSANYLDDLCKDSVNAMVRDRFDSGVWSQRCLMVNLQFDYLVNPTGWLDSVFTYLVEHNLDVSSTELFTSYSEYVRAGRRLDVTLTVNPVSFGYPEITGTVAHSPWSETHRNDDPERRGFVDNWVAYSRAYADALHSAVTRQSSAPVVAFKPALTSLPSASSNSLTSVSAPGLASRFNDQCLAIGFKPGTPALKECVAELQSRRK